MKEYTVRLHGRPVRKFRDRKEAQLFMLNLVETQIEHERQFQYLEEALTKSDLRESLEVLKYIMGK